MLPISPQMHSRELPPAAPPAAPARPPVAAPQAMERAALWHGLRLTPAHWRTASRRSQANLAALPPLRKLWREFALLMVFSMQSLMSLARQTGDRSMERCWRTPLLPQT